MCLSLGSFTRWKTHVETHIFRLKTSLYKVERRGFVLCGNEGASVPRVYRLFLDDDYFSLDTKLNARFRLVLEGSPSFGHRNQESPVLVVLVGSDPPQYVR